MRLVRKIAQQPALAPYVAEEVLPGPGVNTDAEFEDAIRKYGVSNLHPVGTCRMGSDEDAVVDPRLRVHGIGGLRVVGCLDHADGSGGQHQRADHHDRREGLRHDSGGRAGHGPARVRTRARSNRW